MCALEGRPSVSFLSLFFVPFLILMSSQLAVLDARLETQGKEIFSHKARHLEIQEKQTT